MERTSFFWRWNVVNISNILFMQAISTLIILEHINGIQAHHKIWEVLLHPVPPVISSLIIGTFCPIVFENLLGEMKEVLGQTEACSCRKKLGEK